MTLTRANVETILVKRCGPLLTAAGMATTVAGSNADLNDPIGYAIRKSSGTVASFVSVADADLTTVAADEYDQLLDLAELRTLETILGNLDEVDIRVGPRDEKFSQLRTDTEKRLERLQQRIEQEYGVIGVSVETGAVLLDFVDHNEDLAGSE
jgi:hypothetical protein